MISTIHPSTRGAIRRSIKEGYRNWKVAEIHNVTIPQVQEIRRQLRVTVMRRPNGCVLRSRILRNWWS
jgi:ribosomal protein L10